ncbi:hypothetical protein C8Q77DRAFT_666655 [Trametes polyzona]|nr:hypothetical protein C8Q77DRAFT_666655 [Trametes polyzona]
MSPICSHFCRLKHLDEIHYGLHVALLVAEHCALKLSCYWGLRTLSLHRGYNCLSFRSYRANCPLVLVLGPVLDQFSASAVCIEASERLLSTSEASPLNCCCHCVYHYDYLQAQYQ